MHSQISSAPVLSYFPAAFYLAKFASARKFIELHDNSENIIGYNSASILENAMSFIHVDDRKLVHAYFASLDAGEYKLSYRIGSKESSQWVIDRGLVVLDEENAERLFYGIICLSSDSLEDENNLTDILEKKITEGLDFQSKELKRENEALRKQLKEQQESEKARISILESSQLQQSINFEISSCDSISSGNVEEASHIISSKLKSGLNADLVEYWQCVDGLNFQCIANSSSNHLVNKRQCLFNASFIKRLSFSLCIDISDLANDRLEDDVKDIFVMEHEVSSLLIFPMKYDNQLIGFFTIESYQVREWAIDEITFASSMGDQLRTTLNNRDKLNAGEALHKLAYYDTLTGLQNRAAFFENAKREISLSIRNKQKHAFVYIDLDNFKWVNDNLGHDAGDEVLQVVAKNLSASTRETDHVARVGGDEFNLLLLDVKDSSSTEMIIGKILNANNKKLHLRDHDYEIMLSIGVCIIPDDASDLDQAIKLADEAMYKAKKNGKNQFKFA